MNKNMKSIVFSECGSPEKVLHLEEKEIPSPKHGEVLVRMIASPVNPSDILFIQGNYGLKATPPATPGFEGVGIVEKSGGGFLGNWVVGKRVAVLNDRTGNWSEYTTLPSRQVRPIPSAISVSQAACYFVNPATALIMTNRVLGVPRGGILLQTAAASAVGKMIIRLGKHLGFQTINHVRNPDHIDHLKSLGGDFVISGPIESLRDQVLPITSGKGVSYALDPIGGESASAVISCLGQRGKVLLYGLLSGQKTSIDPRFLITGSKIIQGFWLTDYVKSQSILSMLRLFRQLNHLILSGILQTEIGTCFPLEKIQEAVLEAQQNGKPGKVILQIDPKYF